MSMYRVLICFLAGGVLLSLGSGGCTRNKEELPLAADTVRVPVQEFSGSTLFFYNKGTIQWKLDADYMSKPLTDTGSITLIPVRLTLYDTTGMVRSRVLADSGIIGNEMQRYNVWGNVYIRTRDSMVVRTERLRYFREQHKVESDTFVQIETQKGDILRGKGLNATEDFSKFSFKSDVTGKFPDFETRMETNDEAVF
jgi:LPS export ABC transporter protein LptC